ncbi:hypothetical protein [Curtobacterium sp. RRHDQ10]|uniref:hypothetical protein n=1 Tax=Curtobacterium phyllosphaerae TaxID=3413379 RepID=UPI003BF167F4
METERPETGDTLTTTIQPGWSGEVVRVVTGVRAWRTPWPWIGVVVVLTVCGAAFLEGSWLLWIVSFVAAVVVVGVWMAVRSALRRMVDATLPVGSSVAVTYGADTLTVVTSTEAATRSYEHYDRAWVVGAVAFFRVRATKHTSVVPRSIVPETVVERYRQSAVR